MQADKVLQFTTSSSSQRWLEKQDDILRSFLREASMRATCGNTKILLTPVTYDGKIFDVQVTVLKGRNILFEIDSVRHGSLKIVDNDTIKRTISELANLGDYFEIDKAIEGKHQTQTKLRKNA